MSQTLGILNAIKNVIEQYVDGRVSITLDVPIGESAIVVQYATEYRKGEDIVLRTDDKAELHRVLCTDEVEGNHVIFLCNPLTSPFPASDSWVQKIHNGQILNTVYVGTPDHIAEYPAISVEMGSMYREPLTIESVTDTYTINVSVWADATSRTDAYETVLQLTDKCEYAIFKELYPLCEPYVLTLLTDDVAPTDTVIHVDSDHYLIAGSWIWIESSRKRKKHNKVKANPVSNTLELTFPAGGTFVTGDLVIRPLVHLYDPRIESISYDDAEDQDHLLKSSTITYSIKMHRPRVKNSLV